MSEGKAEEKADLYELDDKLYYCVPCISCKHRESKPFQSPCSKCIHFG